MAIRRRQIISPHIRFAASSRGPYANRLGGGLYAKSFGLRDAPADVIGFSVGTDGIMRALLEGSGGSTFSGPESTVKDFEGLIKETRANEIRHTPMRRVSNLIEGNSESILDWNPVNAAVITSATTFTVSGTTSDGIIKTFGVSGSAGDQFRISVKIFADTQIPAGDFRVSLILSGATTQNHSFDVITTSNRRLTTAILTASAAYSNAQIRWQVLEPTGVGANTIHITEQQLERLCCQNNKNPSDYVPVGVLSAEEVSRRSNADGVAYFDYENGNTVNPDDEVIEAKGADINGIYWTRFDPASINRVNEPINFATGANWTGTGNLVSSQSSLESSVQGEDLWRWQASVGSTGNHTFYSNTFTKAAASESWVAIIIAKPDEVGWIALGAENSAGSNFFRRFFNLSTGTEGTSNSSTWSFLDSGTEQLANGDWLYWVRGTATASDTSIRLRVWAADGDNGDFFNLPVGEGFYVQGAQLEQQEAPTALMKQGNVARAADDPDSMFELGNWNNDEGTWSLDFKLSSIGDYQPLMSTSANTFGQMYANNNNTFRTFDGASASDSVDNVSIGTHHRGVIDFATGSTMDVALRDVNGPGFTSASWDQTPANYGSYSLAGGQIAIVYSTGIKSPTHVRNLLGYLKQKGKDWVQRTLSIGAGLILIQSKGGGILLNGGVDLLKY